MSQGPAVDLILRRLEYLDKDRLFIRTSIDEHKNEIAQLEAAHDESMREAAALTETLKVLGVK